MALSGQGLARLHDVLGEHVDSKAGISPTRIDAREDGGCRGQTVPGWTGCLE